MKVKDAHMQAFPFIEPNADDAIKDYHTGITLRDYFAAKALQGMVADPDHVGMAKIAEWAYLQADAMLKARE